MLLRKAHARRLSRLVAGLFAVQIVVTGFCLLTAQAHAMPMAQMGATHMSDTQMGGTSGHCSEAMQGKTQHSDTSHSDGCFHCDEPDQFVKAGTADLTQANLVLVGLCVLPEMSTLAGWDEATPFYKPTGPPRSSSLLFTTTQRIRV
jgi:hypothetical protein